MQMADALTIRCAQGTACRGRLELGVGLGEGALLSRMEAVGAELARNHEQLSRGETRFSVALHFAQRGPFAELTDSSRYQR